MYVRQSQQSDETRFGCAQAKIAGYLLLNLLLLTNSAHGQLVENPSRTGGVPGPSEIVINEIHYRPASGESEFIELHNRSDSSFDLRQLFFRDARSAPISIVSNPKSLEPGGYVVLVQDSESFSRVFREVPHVEPATWPPLNNGGDDVYLQTAEAVIDSVSYEGDWVLPGVSLERIDPAGPSDRFNFAASKDPFGATPGHQNSVFNPDVEPPRIVFVGQKSGHQFEIVFNEPLGSPIPGPDQLGIGGHAPASVELVTEAKLRVQFADEPSGQHLTADGVADRIGNVAERLSSPVAYLPRRGEMAVNEIMFAPLRDAFDGRPDQTEYVELVNTSHRTLSLTGAFWTGRVNESGSADTVHFSSDYAALPPYAYAVIYAAQGELERGAALFNAFAAVPMDGGVPLLLPVDEASLRLRNEGDLVRLHDGRSHVLDSVQYRPSWHHPDLVETRGISLERVDPNTPPHDPGNWTSSVNPLGGTPGSPNSVLVESNTEVDMPGLTISPTPFSPDNDGRDDVAVIAYRLRTNLPVIRVRIFDLAGRPVCTIERGGLGGSEGRLMWDGRDERGRELPQGAYIVLLEAVDRTNRVAEVQKGIVVLARSR